MSIIWCISITNNVNTGKKFNERAQTVKFSALSRLGQELCAETPPPPKKKRNWKVNFPNFPTVTPIQSSTMSKSIPRAFQICMTHGDRDYLHHNRFWPPKSRQISTKYFRAWVCCKNCNFWTRHLCASKRISALINRVKMRWRVKNFRLSVFEHL